MVGLSEGYRLAKTCSCVDHKSLSERYLVVAYDSITYATYVLYHDMSREEVNALLSRVFLSLNTDGQMLHAVQTVAQRVVQVVSMVVFVLGLAFSVVLAISFTLVERNIGT